MRTLIDTRTKEPVNVDNMSDEFKCSLGQYLNTMDALHINTLYFTSDGRYYTVAHEYKGTDKQYKGKKYARFKYEDIDMKDHNNNIKRTRRSIPMPEFEIIAEVEAQFFVDEYIRLKDNIVKSSEEMDIKKTESSLEDYLTKLITKINKK